MPAIAITAMISAFIRVILGAAAVFMLGKIIWSWFLLQTHGGNHDHEEEAKETLKEGLIGFVLVCVTATLATGAVSLAAGVAERYLS